MSHIDMYCREGRQKVPPQSHEPNPAPGMGIRDQHRAGSQLWLWGDSTEVLLCAGSGASALSRQSLSFKDFFRMTHVLVVHMLPVPFFIASWKVRTACLSEKNVLIMFGGCFSHCLLPPPTGKIIPQVPLELRQCGGFLLAWYCPFPTVAVGCFFTESGFTGCYSII